MKVQRPRHALVGALLAASACVPLVASSAEPVLQHKDGLLILPNMRVVNSTPASGAPTNAGVGMRAYRDAQTGELREPTAEDLAADAHAAQRTARRGAIRLQAEAAPLTISLPNGGDGVVLDESFDSYSLTWRAPGNTLAQSCVVGESSAQRMLNLVTRKPLVKEARHAR